GLYTLSLHDALPIFGAAAGGDHVLGEVRAVDRVPDALRGLDRLDVGELGVAAEVGARIRERRLPELEEAVHVPALDILLARVDVDGEVEEVGDGHAELPVA